MSSEDLRLTTEERVDGCCLPVRLKTAVDGEGEGE